MKTWGELKSIVKRYYNSWKDSLLDCHAEPLSFEDVWSEFLYCKDKVKFTKDALVEAIEYAKCKK